MNQILEVLSKCETEAIQDIELDRSVNADDYATVGRLIQVRKIRKAIELAIGKPVKKCRRDLDEILKPGKLFP